MIIKRILFIVNRASATGHNEAVVERLHSILENSLGHEMELQIKVVDEHAQAKEHTQSFLSISDTPALVISGAGGGTLRAIIEGICKGTEAGKLPQKDRVRIAMLRMGSGNIVAKQFGVPLDSEVALRGIIANLKSDRVAPCCIMRCEIGGEGDQPEVCYATAMAGFGQFGRSSGDLARWHRRLPVLRKLIAKFIGIERLNTIEYGLSMLIRLTWCALWPNAAELIQVRIGERTERMRLLVGVVMNFPLKQLPFKPGVQVEEEALSLNLAPHPGRWTLLFSLLFLGRLARKALQFRIGATDRVEIRLLNRDAVEFFLDEDPAVLRKKVTIQVAGTLAFVPGPDYQWPQS